MAAAVSAGLDPGSPRMNTGRTLNTISLKMSVKKLTRPRAYYVPNTPLLLRLRHTRRSGKPDI
jgi:hypothetical protein